MRCQRQAHGQKAAIINCLILIQDRLIIVASLTLSPRPALLPQHKPSARQAQQSYAQQRKPYAALVARNTHVVGVARIV